MKINEFITQVNAIDGMEAYKYQGNRVHVAKYQETWFLSLDLKEPDLDMKWDWSSLNQTTPQQLRATLNCVEELRQTPVSDRFPEKRYRLRWLDDPSGAKNYAWLDRNGEWRLVPDENISYLESEINELKRQHPSQTALIDATKEEVKSDD